MVMAFFTQCHSLVTQMLLLYTDCYGIIKRKLESILQKAGKISGFHASEYVDFYTRVFDYKILFAIKSVSCTYNWLSLFAQSFRDAKAVGRKPFDKMVTLLAYLGPPEYNRLVSILFSSMGRYGYM